MNKKIGIFVDVQNIYYTVMQVYQSHFDYNHLIKKIRTQGKIVVANAYATNKNDQNQSKFQKLLAHFGYRLKLIDYLIRADGSSKADWDMGIAMDMIQNSPSLDRIVLATGDGDFAEVVKYVKSKSPLSVHVYGVPGLTANKLIQAADEYFPIDSEYLLPIPEKWKQ